AAPSINGTTHKEHGMRTSSVRFENSVRANRQGNQATRTAALGHVSRSHLASDNTYYVANRGGPGFFGDAPGLKQRVTGFGWLRRFQIAPSCSPSFAMASAVAV